MQILPCLIGKLCFNLCSYWAPGGPAAHGWLVGFAVVHMSFDSISCFCFSSILKMFSDSIRFLVFDFSIISFISDISVSSLGSWLPSLFLQQEAPGKPRNVLDMQASYECPWGFSMLHISICRNMSMWFMIPMAIWNWTKLRYQRYTVNTQILHLFLQVCCHFVAPACLLHELSIASKCF